MLKKTCLLLGVWAVVQLSASHPAYTTETLPLDTQAPRPATGTEILTYPLDTGSTTNHSAKSSTTFSDDNSNNALTPSTSTLCGYAAKATSTLCSYAVNIMYCLTFPIHYPIRWLWGRLRSKR